MCEPMPEVKKSIVPNVSVERAFNETLEILGYVNEQADTIRNKCYQEVDAMILADYSPSMAWRIALISSTAENDDLLDTSFAQAIIDSPLDSPKDTIAFEETDPERGELEPIRTNSSIKGINYDAEQGKIEPNTFFETAVKTIERRRQLGVDKISPENVATVAHFYYKLMLNADEAKAEPIDAEIVGQWVKTLKDTTKREHLNKIGIGNIMKSIGLMRDQLPEEFYSIMYREAGYNLTKFSHQTAVLFYRGLSEMPTSELHHGYLALFQIAQKMQPVYERTDDLRHSLRAISQFDGRIVPDHTYIEILEKGRAIQETLEPSDLGFCGEGALKIASALPVERSEIAHELRLYAIDCHDRGKDMLRKKALIAAYEKDEALREEMITQIRQEKTAIERLAKSLALAKATDITS